MDTLTKLAAASALALLGCETGTTPPTPTGSSPSDAVQIVLERAQANGLVAQVMVSVSIDGQRAALSGGDALVLHDSLGNTRALEDNGLPWGGEYEAEIATADTALALDFVRASGLARTLPIDLPPPFTLMAPTSVSRAGGIAVSWDATPPFVMSVTASGAPCLPSGGWSRTLTIDPGVVVLQAADFLPTAQPCTIELSAARVDASAVASQIRTITIDTTP